MIFIAVNREAALGVLQAELIVANKLIRSQMRMESNVHSESPLGARDVGNSIVWGPGPWNSQEIWL